MLALFPHTTCFYKAKVDQLPATSTDDYHVLFEDMSYPSGYSPAEPVAQRYVIAINQDEHAWHSDSEVPNNEPILTLPEEIMNSLE